MSKDNSYIKDSNVSAMSVKERLSLIKESSESPTDERGNKLKRISSIKEDKDYEIRRDKMISNIDHHNKYHNKMVDLEKNKIQKKDFKPTFENEAERLDVLKDQNI